MGRSSVAEALPAGQKTGKASSSKKRTAKKKTTKKRAQDRSATAPGTESNTVKEFQYFVASRMKDLRLSHQLSQQQLSAITGLDQAQISQLENNRISPKMTTFFKIIEALDVQPNDFFANMWGGRSDSRGKKANNVEFVANELSKRILMKSRNDKKTREVWNEYEASRGENPALLARLLVKVFFVPQFRRSISDAMHLPDYHKFLIGEMVGLMMSDEGSKKYLTELERTIPGTSDE